MPKRPNPARPQLRRRRSSCALTALAAGLFLAASASAHADEDVCPGPAFGFDANGATFAIPKGGAAQPLHILAIGSSSTEGIGASTPAHTYPAQLEHELTDQDGIAADVTNAGIGGELAAKTLPRLLGALKSGWARLVIWQVGTNDAITGVDETAFRATVERGVAATRTAGVPLLLVGPQFTPTCPDQARYEQFVSIVDEIGTKDHVPVLSRFAMMTRRGAKSALGLLSGDRLHMNDRGYHCLAHTIAGAIEDATGAKL